jgi:hypothetical protein
MVPKKRAARFALSGSGPGKVISCSNRKSSVLTISRFRRIWVIQEFVYATDIVVFCGNTEVDWLAMFVVASLHQSTPLTLYSAKRFEHILMQWDWFQSLEVHGPGAGVLCFYKMCALRIRAWDYPSSLATFFKTSDLKVEGSDSKSHLKSGKPSVFKIPTSLGTQELKEFMKATKTSTLSSRAQGHSFPKFDFSTLLFDSNQYLFSNLKDRFYALLALGANTQFEEFTPRYSNTESVQDVCYRFTIRLLLNGHCSEILSLAGHLSSNPVLLGRRPSWVPDWTAPARNLGHTGNTMCVQMAEHRRHTDVVFEGLMDQVERIGIGQPTWQEKYNQASTLRCVANLKRFDVDLSDLEIPEEKSEGELTDTLCPEYRLYRAAKESKPECQVESEQLLIKGSRVDSIILVLPGPLDSAPYFYEESVRAIMREYPTGEPLTEVIWRTLIANRSALAQGSPLRKAPDEYEKDYKLARFISGNEVVELSWKTGLEPDGFCQSLSQTRGRYNLCITYGGYIGLFPLNTQLGDEIAVIHGCDTPFVVRRSTTDRDGSYTVIGECYIHGMMQGELFESPRFTVETIKLR